MIAGYQNALENNFWGLTNSTQEVVGLMNQYGQSGLDLYGHSRGGMTIGNAETSIITSGGKNVLGNTSIYFFGPAYNAQKSANQLYVLSGGKQNSVTLENYKDDFVGSWIGGNPASNTRIPNGSNWIKEGINMLGGKETVHSCYGDGHGNCNIKYGNSISIIIKARGK